MNHLVNPKTPSLVNVPKTLNSVESITKVHLFIYEQTSCHDNFLIGFGHSLNSAGDDVTKFFSSSPAKYKKARMCLNKEY
jgi:hypothetical protein